MALHCAATLLLVTPGAAPDAVAGAGAEVVAPLPDGADVVAELQALADLHRGERVVVPLAPAQLAAALDRLGRAVPTQDASTPVQLEIGDDGWALLPTAR